MFLSMIGFNGFMSLPPSVTFNAHHPAEPSHVCPDRAVLLAIHIRQEHSSSCCRVTSLSPRNAWLQAMGQVAAFYNSSGAVGPCVDLAAGNNLTAGPNVVYSYQGCTEGAGATTGDQYPTNGVTDMFWNSGAPPLHTCAMPAPPQPVAAG